MLLRLRALLDVPLLRRLESLGIVDERVVTRIIVFGDVGVGVVVQSVASSPPNNR